MSNIIWKEKAIDFLDKLPENESDRIVRKVDTEIKFNPQRFLEHLENMGLPQNIAH